MKFKVGDRVRLISLQHGRSRSNPYWPEYKIEGIVDHVYYPSSGLPVHVKWNNGTSNVYNDRDLEVMINPIMDVNELFEDIEI